MSVAAHTASERRKLGDITNGKDLGKVRKSTAKQVKHNLAPASETNNHSQLIVEHDIVHGDNPNMRKQEQPSLVPPAVNEDYSNLLMEKTFLLKIIAEKNQIIEQKNLELQKHRIFVQQLQLQNLELARANSQMLAENNIGKDKLKILKHELTCTKAALRVKDIDKKRNQQPTGDTVVGDESRLAPCISKVFPSSTNSRESVKDKFNTGRTRQKQCSSSKPDECEHESPVNQTNVQLVSYAAPIEVENQNNDEKIILIKSETELFCQTSKPIALQEREVCEPNRPISLNDSSSGTNSHRASRKGKKPTKNLQVNAEMAKQPHKRKHSSPPCEAVKGTSSKLRQSEESSQPTCLSKPIVNIKNSVDNPDRAQSVDNPEVGGKEQASPSDDGQAFPTTSRRKKRPSSPSQIVDLQTRKSLTGRPSRSSTIGINYKEISINVKMRRNA